ncbi:hypothetical protein ACU3L3_26785 [Priestia endophytica]|jgi:hypothetical protein|uniref:Uncharacterized protein n=1 Tax=Acinetobacter variabilis TaxID=70346 RepID=A0A7T8ARX6_9GAMM|nr:MULTISPECIES: hypothetical protein [Acinetobacter]KGH50907.1 hypothetical protein GS19_05155 [Acinetobacter idrijaensis]EEY88416.1 hypothetical protein HMPREF0017_02958 [Acinetobacter lwoffii SH145]MDP1318213.1 hypothetical protein [Acinetobacter lwoffii]NHB65999.1 hypothetical protein [Acinetobacter sp. GFQ9D191M]NHC01194.1 hypothetical protein [Acinetobacter sp. GFQ9D192M]
MSNYFEELGLLHATELDAKSVKTLAMSFKLPEPDLMKLDVFCEDMGINRSKFIHMLLDDQKAFDALKTYMLASQKNIDDLALPDSIRGKFETYLQLEDPSSDC